MRYPWPAKSVFRCIALLCCILAFVLPQRLASITYRNRPIPYWASLVFNPPAPPREPAEPETFCNVDPLPPIVDPQAQAFEDRQSLATGGLVPAMGRALVKFEALVSSVGGKFELHSAYRPPAYQQHLQQLWFKWMDMRENADQGCQLMRSEIYAEFRWHGLLETQKPVTKSDHTRGLAFDATVLLPSVPMLKKHPMSLDRLATLAGIVRPDIVRDPVHYKLAHAPTE